jgi:hypothetical protein
MFNYRYRPYIPPPNQFNNNGYKNNCYNYFQNNQSPSHNNNCFKNANHINNYSTNNIGNTAFKKDNDLNINNELQIFEIFGLKIYFDDLLILCLLFFLYKEGIKDHYLFISLILLLLN